MAQLIQYASIFERPECAESRDYGLNPECLFLADSVEKLEIFLDDKIIYTVTKYKY